MKNNVLASFALSLSVALTGWADTVILRDGTRHNGTFIDGSSRSINFEEDNGNRRRYETRDVQSLEFNSQTSQSGQTSSVFRNSDNQTVRSGNSRSRVESNSGGYTRLPTGTDVVVRTNEAINSKTATEGRTFSANIDKDVMDGSTVVIPRGSEGRLVVNKASGGDLVLDLQSVTVAGRSYLLNTADLSKSTDGVGVNKRTATYGGGGAVLGTLLGAIAGGGKGAAIGAIAGAAAGVGAEVLTKGKEVKVPAETILTFRLDQDLVMEPAR